MYFTDRGIEELGERRGEDQVMLGWLAARLPATWLARADNEDGEL